MTGYIRYRTADGKSKSPYGNARIRTGESHSKADDQRVADEIDDSKHPHSSQVQSQKKRKWQQSEEEESAVEVGRPNKRRRIIGDLELELEFGARAEEDDGDDEWEDEDDEDEDEEELTMGLLETARELGLCLELDENCIS